MEITISREQLDSIRKAVVDYYGVGLTYYNSIGSPLAMGAGGDWLEAQSCTPERLIEIAMSLGLVSIS